MVLKLRAARIARETRESQTKNASAVPGKILPTPDEQVLTQTLTNHGIPEVHRVSYKRPRNLHQQATLRRFDQARLRRWWNWHDKHMELLREDKLQKSRRQQFLSNLRTHAWITPPPSPAAGQQNPEQQQQQQRPMNVQATDEIKQRKERAQHLTKLRTSSAPNLRLQGGKAEVVVLSPVSPVDANNFSTIPTAFAFISHDTYTHCFQRLRLASPLSSLYIHINVRLPLCIYRGAM
ncbi:uncharacterized protein EV422DRAFT_52, partial [Fimicolochytrium jonesii]|uniref:uncharacterized protein n=1 Tax=Fimicolochytrium jonesii TaxID=1396493 RepID=UPI0022FF3FCD